MDGTPISLLRPEIKEYNTQNNTQNKMQNQHQHQTSGFVQSNTETVNSNSSKSYDSNYIDPDMKRMLKPVNNIKNVEVKKQIKSTTTDNNTNTNTKTDTDTTSTNTETEIVKIKKVKKSFLQKIPQYIVDPIILFIIYLLMSQEFVKRFIGNYVNVINPDETGFVGIKGILAYGMVLVLTYNVTRLIVHKIRH